MKKYVFYPVLFSINPILLLLAVNITTVSISQLFPVILITPLIAIGLMWLLNKWLTRYSSGWIHRFSDYFLVFLLHTNPCLGKYNPYRIDFLRVPMDSFFSLVSYLCSIIKRMVMAQNNQP